MRSLTAAAALAAAVAVSALARQVLRRRRRARGRLAAQRLMAGCAARDNAALRVQMEVFRRRLGVEVARAEAVAEAEQTVDMALAALAAGINTEGGAL